MEEEGADATRFDGRLQETQKAGPFYHAHTQRPIRDIIAAAAAAN